MTACDISVEAVQLDTVKLRIKIVIKIIVIKCLRHGMCDKTLK